MAKTKFLLAIVVTAMLVLFIISASAVSEFSDESDNEHANDPSAVEPHDPKQDADDDHEPETPADNSLISVGLRRFLASRRTCDKFPRICRRAGSPGPYCCKKRCVNILRDRANCGACGRKCRFNQTCCSGRCTRLSFDRNNCGRCGKRCGRFQRCFAGLCSYA